MVLVNYNGRDFLNLCLPALLSQDYPSEAYQVIVVDNASHDSSLEMLRRDFPQVRIIANQTNLGFAGGNNTAMQATAAEYVVLVNNDTKPSPSWLSSLVATAQRNPRAGAVTGHLQLLYPQLEIEISSPVAVYPPDPRELGVRLFELDSGAPWGVVQYLEGFDGWEYFSPSERFRWTKGKARLGVPIPERVGDLTVSILMAGDSTARETIPVAVRCQGRELGKFFLRGPEKQRHSFVIPSDLTSKALPLEQNTGALIAPNGMARDRGTYVRGSEAYFESESGKYLSEEEVFAGCGASLLLRGAALRDAGVFDPAFFMYYEDIDLCWRMRLRGWSVIYDPAAMIRHVHSGTTKIWSPFFLYLIERNRLAMVFKNGSCRQVARVWIGWLWKALREALHSFPWRYGWRGHARHTLVNARVFFNLLWQLPGLILKRARIQSKRKIDPKALSRWFKEL